MVSAGIAVLFSFCPSCLRFIQRRWNGFFVASGLSRCVLSLDVFTLFFDYARFSLKKAVFNAQLGEGLDLTLH